MKLKCVLIYAKNVVALYLRNFYTGDSQTLGHISIIQRACKHADCQALRQSF